MKALDANTKNLENKFKELDAEFESLILTVPNIPSKDTPIGPDESANIVVESWGQPRKFDFPIKDHLQLGKDLDLIDIEAGVKTSGFRGYYLKNEAVLLHFAIFGMP